MWSLMRSSGEFNSTISNTVPHEKIGDYEEKIECQQIKSKRKSSSNKRERRALKKQQYSTNPETA